MTVETEDAKSKPNPLYDPKVRAIFAQIVVIVAFVVFVLYIIDNTQDNLARLGISTGFDFMGIIAGFMPTGPNFNMTNFDVNKSTHGDVFILGLVNTLLISAIGIVLATIVGFVMGVMRLSHNVLIRFVAVMYIEGTRNVPLLLQILIWYFGVILLLPNVKSSINIFDLFFLSDRYLAFPAISFEATAGYALIGLIVVCLGVFFAFCRSQFKKGGDRHYLWVLWLFVGFSAALPVSILIRPLFGDLTHYLLMNPVAAVFYGFMFTRLQRLMGSVSAAENEKPAIFSMPQVIIGFLIGLPISGFCMNFGIGPFLAMMALVSSLVGVYSIVAFAQRRMDETGQPLPVMWLVLGLVIGVPLLVLIVSGFPVNFSVPALKGFNFQGGAQVPAAMMGLLAALVFYTGAFIAENVRAGIQSVSHGQTEAARALGFRPGKTMRLVIIPQAMRVIVPPVTSQYLNLTKNSSLAIAIGYPDLVNVFTGISLNQTGKAIEIIGLTMLVYLTISLLISLFMNWYNKTVALVER